jgi:hypothetical protein
MKKTECSSSTTVLLCEYDILFVHPANVLWSKDTFLTKKIIGAFCGRAIESVTYVTFRAADNFRVGETVKELELECS